MLMEKLVYVAQLGARVVLYVLMALSVLSVGVIIERWWYFRRRRLDTGSLADTLRKLLRGGNVDEARALLKKSRAVEAEIVGEVAGQRAVPAADEDRSHRRHVRIQPGFHASLDSSRVGLGLGQVLLGGEEQGHVDRHAGEDRLLDRLQSGRGAGDLDEEIRPGGQGVKPGRVGRSRRRIVGQ